MLRSHKWERSGRIHGQGRAERHDEIGIYRRLTRALEFYGTKILAEADRGRFQEPATLAEWWFPIEPEVFEMRLRISAPVTALTFDQCICAVKFDEAFGTGAGEAMQAVDVLRDNGAKFSGFFQGNDRMMNGIGPGVAESISPFELVIPMLDPRRFRHHEIVEVNGLPSGPHALRPAEIRNAATR